MIAQDGINGAGDLCANQVHHLQGAAIRPKGFVAVIARHHAQVVSAGPLQGVDMCLRHAVGDIQVQIAEVE